MNREQLEARWNRWQEMVDHLKSEDTVVTKVVLGEKESLDAVLFVDQDTFKELLERNGVHDVTLDYHEGASLHLHTEGLESVQTRWTVIYDPASTILQSAWDQVPVFEIEPENLGFQDEESMACEDGLVENHHYRDLRWMDMSDYSWIASSEDELEISMKMSSTRNSKTTCASTLDSTLAWRAR